MKREVMALLREDDAEILRVFDEEPSLAAYLAVQNRILDLHSDRDPKVTTFINKVTLKVPSTLPEELQGPHDMLYEFTMGIMSKYLKIREAKRIHEVTRLSRHTSMKNLLSHLVTLKRFTRPFLETHPEHRHYLDTFEWCIEEGYIRAYLLADRETGETLYYATWKAQSLVSDWIRYDID